jgi:DNA (cytosine-5)-methyltransferase 1
VPMRPTTDAVFPPIGLIDCRVRMRLEIAGLFAGIGGIELGLERAGHSTALLCEREPAAQRVLQQHFPRIPLVGDIDELYELPEVDLVTAGFPCQDLSQAGRTAGISGSRSGLVGHVFRLLDTARHRPTWLLLENVSFMLAVDRGAAMNWLTEQLEVRGYNWAYRVVDSRAFGLPQRRQRVILLASRTEDPRPALLGQDHGEIESVDRVGLACGFYWTEGLRGLGWAVDAIPTLKAGSALGIPSAPAIYRSGSGQIITPDIRDAERLQGFPSDWTAGAEDFDGRRRSSRWRLVGNAVSEPVARWVGERLNEDASGYSAPHEPMPSSGRWPRAAWGWGGKRRQAVVSMWPVAYRRPHLHDFLHHDGTPLSARATRGFLERTRRSRLHIPEDLICETEAHLEKMERMAPLRAA